MPAIWSERRHQTQGAHGRFREESRVRNTHLCTFSRHAGKPRAPAVPTLVLESPLLVLKCEIAPPKGPPKGEASVPNRLFRSPGSCWAARFQCAATTRLQKSSRAGACPPYFALGASTLWPNCTMSLTAVSFDRCTDQDFFVFAGHCVSCGGCCLLCCRQFRPPSLSLHSLRTRAPHVPYPHLSESRCNRHVQMAQRIPARARPLH